MHITKLFTPARRGPSHGGPQAVIVCVDKAHGDVAGPGDDEVEQLALRLRRAVVDGGLGEYDGCDSFSSESRLFFFTAHAERLAAVAMDLIASLPWRQCVHLRLGHGREAVTRGTLSRCA